MGNLVKTSHIGWGLLGLLLTGSAFAEIAGPADGYNVFIFGNGSFTGQNSETIGNLAAGGAVSLTSYGVATGITGNGSRSMTTPDPARLVVGGTVTLNSGGEVGASGSGTIYYGGSAPVSNNGGSTAAATVGNQTLVNFSTSQTLYTNYSQQLGSLAGTNLNLSGSTSLNLTGLQSGLNVIDLQDGSGGITLSSINLNGASNATVLINVQGSGPVDFNFLSQTGDISGAQVLFNMVATNSVNVNGTLSAAILAPHAGVTGADGDINGQLVAASYSGSNEFTNVAFDGTLPAPVPLPGTAWLLISGLLLGSATRWPRPTSIGQSPPPRRRRRPAPAARARP